MGKHLRQPHYRQWLPTVMLALTAAAWSQPGGAVPIEALIDPNANQPLQLDWSANGGTGIRLQNPQGVGGSVSIELLDGPAPALDTPQGFVLLDNTLRVNSSLPSQGRRLRARMDFGRVGGRAGIRALGLRANSLRLLRADFSSGRWIRAINSIRQPARADIRFITGGRADLRLGHFGIDNQRQTVWAVLDTSGEQLFAIGALRVVEPVSWLLLLTGLGYFVVARRGLLGPDRPR